jgi:hypothetical protein
MKTKKYPKLRGTAKKLAGKYIAEEMSTHKYGRKQAIAIGISRAKAKTAKAAKKKAHR